MIMDSQEKQEEFSRITQKFPWAQYKRDLVGTTAGLPKSIFNAAPFIGRSDYFVCDFVPVPSNMKNSLLHFWCCRLTNLGMWTLQQFGRDWIVNGNRRTQLAIKRTRWVRSRLFSKDATLDITVKQNHRFEIKTTIFSVRGNQVTRRTTVRFGGCRPESYTKTAQKIV